jgi:hypothetical protein
MGAEQSGSALRGKRPHRRQRRQAAGIAHQGKLWTGAIRPRTRVAEQTDAPSARGIGRRGLGRFQFLGNRPEGASDDLIVRPQLL